MIQLADSEGPDQTEETHADLDLCCPHLPEDMFLHGTAHLLLCHVVNNLYGLLLLMNTC